MGPRLRAARRRQAELEAAVADAQRQRADDAQYMVRLRLSLGAIEDGLVIFDQGGDVVYSNEAGTNFLQARHGDVLVTEAITRMGLEAVEGRDSARELELFGPPRRILNLRAVPLGDPLAPTGALVVVEDASTRRRLEKVRSDFVANVSHELKTPVGGLALLAETLLGEDDAEVMRRLAERIGNEAFRLGHTIEDLLELSRLEASPSQEDGEVAVGPVVLEAVERVASVARQQDICMEVEELSEDLWVLGNRPQLVSAVSNLVDNAVKYSEPGDRVEVRARKADRWVEVEVQDHGIGIPQHDLERIFERFYRVDRARSRETGGTGLGLAIVGHVASNHQGDVRVQSREGEGSCFVLRLPAASMNVSVSARSDDA